MRAWRMVELDELNPESRGGGGTSSYQRACHIPLVYESQRLAGWEDLTDTTAFIHLYGFFLLILAHHNVPWERNIHIIMQRPSVNPRRLGTFNNPAIEQATSTPSSHNL